MPLYIPTPVPVALGGTGAMTAAAARSALGVDVWRAIADTDTTALSTDKAIGYTSITAARTVTLPAASALNAGQELIIGDVSGSASGTLTITIARAGSDTINGATSYVIATPRGAVSLISDGSSKWYFNVVGPGLGGALPSMRFKKSGSTAYTIPGVFFANLASVALVANKAVYMPIQVYSATTYDQFAINVTTLAAGATVRMGIYNADRDGQPTSLVLDAGTVSVATTGVKTISINLTLPPGNYLMVINSDGAPTLRGVRGGSWFGGLDAALDATNTFILRVDVTQTYGAYPDPGTVWDTISANNNSYHYYCFLRQA